MHKPDGKWLYGVELSVHPDYRRRGIARALYGARQYRVIDYSLKGQLTGGMMSGYGAVKNEISAQDYYNELLQGTRVDPTISAQMAVGFQPVRLMKDYGDDPICDNYGVLIVMKAEKFNA